MPGIKYDGVVVTSIAVVDKGGGKVEFDGTSPTGDEARFLKDVVEVEAAGGSKKFTATEISATDAKQIIHETGSKDADTTPLFCVHGFNVEPDSMLKTMSSRLGAFESKGKNLYYPIPVLWPCDSEKRLGIDKQRSYEKDQEDFSQEAGGVLFKFVNFIPDHIFPRKSLLMHSMGNHVIFNGACGFSTPPQVKFENIFMVAADVPFDVFHQEPNENYLFNKVYKEKQLKASNFFQMLAKTPTGACKGKLCLLHNHKDWALTASSWALNWDYRLGQRGIKRKGGSWYTTWYVDDSVIRPEIVGNYENYDCSEFRGKMKDPYEHSYQFDDFAIEYYAEKAKAIQN